MNATEVHNPSREASVGKVDMTTNDHLSAPTRYVEADDRRKVHRPLILQVAVTLEHVFRVDADPGHLDEDVAHAHLRIRHVLIVHHFRAAVRAHNRSFHVLFR